MPDVPTLCLQGTCGRAWAAAPGHSAGGRGHRSLALCAHLLQLPAAARVCQPRKAQAAPAAGHRECARLWPAITRLMIHVLWTRHTFQESQTFPKIQTHVSWSCSSSSASCRPLKMLRALACNALRTLLSGLLVLCHMSRIRQLLLETSG